MLLLIPENRPHGTKVPVLHEYADDLESHFHLLLYEILLYLQLEEFGTYTVLENFIFDYFDKDEFDEMEQRVYGGERKRRFFTETDIMPITVKNNKPLTKLIGDMREYFRARYTRKNYTTAEGGVLLKEQFGNPTGFLKLINEALEAEGWPENDKVARFFTRFDDVKRKLDPHNYGNVPNKRAKSTTNWI